MQFTPDKYEGNYALLPFGIHKVRLDGFDIIRYEDTDNYSFQWIFIEIPQKDTDSPRLHKFTQQRINEKVTDRKKLDSLLNTIYHILKHVVPREVITFEKKDDVGNVIEKVNGDLAYLAIVQSPDMYALGQNIKKIVDDYRNTPIKIKISQKVFNNKLIIDFDQINKPFVDFQDGTKLVFSEAKDVETLQASKDTYNPPSFSDVASFLT